MRAIRGGIAGRLPAHATRTTGDDDHAAGPLLCLAHDVLAPCPCARLRTVPYGQQSVTLAGEHHRAHCRNPICRLLVLLADVPRRIFTGSPPRRFERARGDREPAERDTRDAAGRRCPGRPWERRRAVRAPRSPRRPPGPPGPRCSRDRSADERVPPRSRGAGPFHLDRVGPLCPTRADDIHCDHWRFLH